MSDVVKLAAPTCQGWAFVQSSGGVWFLDTPKGAERILPATREDGTIITPSQQVNGLLSSSGYPTAKGCSPRKGEQGNKCKTQSGVIIDGTAIEVAGGIYTPPQRRKA